MPLSTDNKALALANNLLGAFDKLNGGEYPGFRPAHAKGILLAGVFQPSREVASLTRAPHARRETPVSVRLSDFAGVPAVPDGSAEASPRGFAIRFHLGEHVHTDIVAHSVDNFPARTAEDFGEFLAAVAATTPSQPHPNAIEHYLAAHPKALAFVQTPKPVPTSFARESFFAVSAFKFVAPNGSTRFGRYRILPDGANEYLDAVTAASRGVDFLFEEIRQRIANGGVKYRIVVQLAEPGDILDDATVRWPESRERVEFGEVSLHEVVAENQAEQRQIIFDPIPRVEGIEPSADPLFNPRADLYLLSGRRRRAAGAQATLRRAS